MKRKIGNIKIEITKTNTHTYIHIYIYTNMYMYMCMYFFFLEMKNVIPIVLKITAGINRKLEMRDENVSKLEYKLINIFPKFFKYCQYLKKKIIKLPRGMLM